LLQTHNLSFITIRDYVKINSEFLKRLSGPAGPYQGLSLGGKSIGDLLQTQNLSLTTIRDYIKINSEFLKRLSGPAGPYQGFRWHTECIVYGEFLQ